MIKPTFETVWQTVKREGAAAIGQALLDRESGYVATIRGYRESDQLYEVEYSARMKTVLVDRGEMAQRFSGLVPWELMTAITLKYREPGKRDEVVTRNLMAAPGAIWNRWFHVYLIGDKPNHLPSVDLTPFERRVYLSAWLWRNGSIELQPEYRLSVR